MTYWHVTIKRICSYLYAKQRHSKSVIYIYIYEHLDEPPEHILVYLFFSTVYILKLHRLRIQLLLAE